MKGRPVNYDHASLSALKDNSPAWRLLRANHSPMIISFLHRVFIAPSVRMISTTDLTVALDDELTAHREWCDYEGGFPDQAIDYLNRWASPDVGYLRKFYPPGADEPFFDLTPATEKAIGWVGTLVGRSFVGTESRLLTLVDLLRQMDSGSETDPTKRVAELQRRRDEIDREMERILKGDVPLLGDTEMKDRFQQFEQIERELLGDFREVEHNFRMLDRKIHERITLWDGGKGELLDEIMNERDAIWNSDQGRSFRGFWDFVMSGTRRDDFRQKLEQVLKHPAVMELNPDKRIRRILSDWLDAGDCTQRTVAGLSRQLRRFIDDKARLENRRIMEILSGIERKAIQVRENPPQGNFMDIVLTSAELGLPMERPMYTIKVKPVFSNLKIEVDEQDVDADALFGISVVNRAACIQNIQGELLSHGQVSLQSLLERHPLEHGLAELVTYFQLGVGEFSDCSTISEGVTDEITWSARGFDNQPITRMARVPRLVFVRRIND